MHNSIKYFEEECINRFEKLEDDFIKEPQKLAEYVLGLTEELHKLGLQMIQESLEEMDTMLVSVKLTTSRKGYDIFAMVSLIRS